MRNGGSIVARHVIWRADARGASADVFGAEPRGRRRATVGLKGMSWMGCGRQQGDQGVSTICRRQARPRGLALRLRQRTLASKRSKKKVWISTMARSRYLMRGALVTYYGQTCQFPAVGRLVHTVPLCVYRSSISLLTLLCFCRTKKRGRGLGAMGIVWCLRRPSRAASPRRRDRAAARGAAAVR